MKGFPQKRTRSLENCRGRAGKKRLCLEYKLRVELVLKSGRRAAAWPGLGGPGADMVTPFPESYLEDQEPDRSQVAAESSYHVTSGVPPGVQRKGLAFQLALGWLGWKN